MRETSWKIFSSIQQMLLLCPLPLKWGAYCFCSVCVFVCLFVCLCPTLTLAITFEILQVETSYLACMCISWSLTFCVQTCKGQGHPSRSKVKYIGQITKFNIVFNFLTSLDRDFIIGMHMYLMKPHIFSANMSRSRSPFKVKGQIKVKRHFCDKTLWGHCCFTNTAFLLLLLFGTYHSLDLFYSSYY